MKRAKEKGAKLEREVLADLKHLYPDAVRCRQESIEADDKPDVRAGPFSVECKNRKNINIHEAFAQAKRRKDPLTVYPVVVAQITNGKREDRRLVVMEYIDWLSVLHGFRGGKG